MTRVKKIINHILHDGLLKYKYKHSKIRPIDQRPGEAKGAIFAYRSKEKMIASRGLVLTSEEALQENQNNFTHWTPNVFRYGTYADKARQFTKGHSENNLRQINTFFVDFDLQPKGKKITTSDILLASVDLGFMPTMILKTTRGYQAYFVLEKPAYVTVKTNFKVIKAAKMISQNLREYFAKSLPVDLTCNHFGIARIPRSDNIAFFEPSYSYSFAKWQNWSYKRSNDKAEKPQLIIVKGMKGKRQVDEPWFDLLLHETRFKGEKGLIGRNNATFTLALACYSSGLSFSTCEYNLYEFNQRLNQPLTDQEVTKAIKSAYSGDYQAAKRDYVEHLCKEWVSDSLTSKDLFNRQGWSKFKKRRSERQRVHLSEWKDDLLAYISQKIATDKPYLVTTKKAIREAIGIPERSLDKLLHVLKDKQQLFFKVRSGRNGGIQIATLQSLLLALIKRKKEEQQNYIAKLIAEFGANQQELETRLLSFVEKPIRGEQIDLLRRDTG